MIEPVSFEQPDPRKVAIGWKDGRTTVIDARTLRLTCPCASCVDEITGRRMLDPATVSEEVGVADTDLVGRYAFRFRFSDGHDTGIFTFDYLRQIGDESPAD